MQLILTPLELNIFQKKLKKLWKLKLSKEIFIEFEQTVQ